ncbi:MAG: 50S ribosomal protein L16 3-hydroxylase [Gammaproteobacteria bacterium]|jgi:50S ribosomal protein L16 3-hydroxylase
MYQLQNLDLDVFLNEYWQKKPCLIRQAFQHFESPISPEELAGLACEKEVHSRLVLEKGGSKPWQLKYGPFEESDFLSLPETHYSLLVSECEKWVPEFADLIEQFRFIPNWRIDDLMVSYAPPGGSVGPHNDEYDVFLLQAEGHRHWQYSDKRVVNPDLVPDTDLAILQTFEFDHEATLAPGDMLYLPPGVAHFGAAVDRCLTCSIGFRAPTATEVLESVALEIDRAELGSKRYSDPKLETNRHPSEVTTFEMSQFKAMITTLLQQPDALWQGAIGKLLSDGVMGETDEFEVPTDFDALREYHWVKNVDSKMLYHLASEHLQFYCNGEMYQLSTNPDVIDVIQTLCSQRHLSPALLDACESDAALKQLILTLAITSAILPEED